MSARDILKHSRTQRRKSGGARLERKRCANQLGTISADKKADVIAVRGDVLEYINLLQHVDFVMKGGVVYKQGGQPVEENLQ